MRFGSAIACTLARNDYAFQALVSTMEKAIVDLTSALRERLAIIRDEESRRNESAHLARLKAVSEKIDQLQAALPRPIDPQLAHYLQRRSYDKALEFIENTIRRSTAR
jgi:hypothetical protein